MKGLVGSNLPSTSVILICKLANSLTEEIQTKLNRLVHINGFTSHGLLRAGQPVSNTGRALCSIPETMGTARSPDNRPGTSCSPVLKTSKVHPKSKQEDL